ncbi:MAG: MATE family efflux transporter [Candidatus Accumulibacter sp.]|nr:MATE family efflux transporter [Accumulibacter sp.]
MKSAPLSLGTADVGKLLAQYAIPAIISMAAASIYNITDSIFIGHGVGPLALSGLTITFPLMNLGAAFGTLVGVGGSALLSLRLGQKDYEAANYILGNVVSLNFLMGIGLTVPVLVFLEPILVFFGASENVLPYAYDFMTIIIAGNVVTHMYWGLNALMRSSGHPKKSMYATLVTIGINLVLNPLFIFVFHWGIKGSAFATVLSQIVVLAWQFIFFSDKNNFICLRRGIFGLRHRIVSGILSIGMAPFLLNSATCVIVILINRELSVYGGDLAIGAYGIVNRVAFLFVMVIFGINQGMQPIAGYNYGAGLYGRVVEALRKSVISAVAVMTAGFLIVEIFPHYVASMFSGEQELIDLAVPGLRYVFFVFPFNGVQIVAAAFFQSIGKAYKTIFLSLTRQVLFLIPLVIILPKFFGIKGIWMSMPLSDSMAFAVCAGVLYFEIRKMRKGAAK